MSNTLPTGSTAITDPSNPANQEKVNADGSTNVDVTGALTSATSALTSVGASTSGVALLAANAARKAAYVYNDSTAIMYLGLVAHATVSTTVYTTQVPAQDFYELPTSPVYTGEISAVWSAANGNARITELS